MHYKFRAIGDIECLFFFAQVFHFVGAPPGAGGKAALPVFFGATGLVLPGGQSEQLLHPQRRLLRPVPLPARVLRLIVLQR
jgi:hypothetical protein